MWYRFSFLLAHSIAEPVWFASVFSSLVKNNDMGLDFQLGMSMFFVVIAQRKPKVSMGSFR